MCDLIDSYLLTLQALKEMLAAKERTLFKCMGFSCMFSSGDSGQFSRHLADHHTEDQLLAALRTVHVPTAIILFAASKPCFKSCPFLISGSGFNWIPRAKLKPEGEKF
jgi:hypothetical protein